MKYSINHECPNCKSALVTVVELGEVLPELEDLWEEENWEMPVLLSDYAESLEKED